MSTTTYYIQRRGYSPRMLETVDEFTTRKEARVMCREYQYADPSAHYYVSTRACKEWSAKP